MELLKYSPDAATARALKLWVVLNRSVRAIEDHLRLQVEAHGVTLTEFAVLEALRHKGPLPLGEVGHRVLRKSGSMTYVIDKLEKRGLLRRKACPGDRRSYHAELTDAGRAAIDTIFPEHARTLAALASALTSDEQETATALLRTLGLAAAATTNVLQQ